MNSKNYNEKYILKDNFNLDSSNYEKIKLAQQYNQLYSDEYSVNKKNEIEYNNKKIYNLSLKDLLTNASFVYMKIISELSIFINNDKKDINNLGLIFTKDDRLLYIGLLVLVISFCLWIINISE